jgi:hypothetical protein
MNISSCQLEDLEEREGENNAEWQMDRFGQKRHERNTITSTSKDLERDSIHCWSLIIHQSGSINPPSMMMIITCFFCYR